MMQPREDTAGRPGSRWPRQILIFNQFLWWAQVGSRAERMGLRASANVFLYSATRLEDVLREVMAMRPRAVIIDSIQTVYLDDVAGSAGSVSQARALRTAAHPEHMPGVQGCLQTRRHACFCSAVRRHGRSMLQFCIAICCQGALIVSSLLMVC